MLVGLRGSPALASSQLRTGRWTAAVTAASSSTMAQIGEPGPGPVCSHLSSVSLSLTHTDRLERRAQGEGERTCKEGEMGTASARITAQTVTVTRQRKDPSTVHVASCVSSAPAPKMPILLPQLPTLMFSTYNPSYIPGYTGYTPKLRSHRGSIFGKAAFQFCDTEPGFQRSLYFPLSARREKNSLSSDLHLKETPSGMPRDNVENWNSKSACFYPARGKYNFIRVNHTLDGDPKISKAINAIEKTKHELSKPAHKDRCASVPSGLKTPKEAAKCTTVADQAQRAESPHSPTHKQDKLKTVKKDVTEKKHSSDMTTKSDLLPQKKGKIIYRTDSGLLPNYSGYIPGQTFNIGKTWGRSTVDALGKYRGQEFHFTSLC